MRAMNWHRRLAALFVILALAGCAQGITGRSQAPYPVHPPENSALSSSRATRLLRDTIQYPLPSRAATMWLARASRSTGAVSLIVFAMILYAVTKAVAKINPRAGGAFHEQVRLNRRIGDRGAAAGWRDC